MKGGKNESRSICNFKKKTTLSVEEQTVIDAFEDAVADIPVSDKLKKAQDALVAKPSTTS